MMSFSAPALASSLDLRAPGPLRASPRRPSAPTVGRGSGRSSGEPLLVTLARVPARALVEGGAPVESSTCGVRAIMAGGASSGAFCGSSRLRQGSGRERLVAPAVELSFAVEREAAAEAIRRFVLGRWLAPADVDPAELPAPTAVLLPSWVYHVQSTVQYRGRRGDDAWSSGGSATDRPLLGRPI